MFAIFLRKNDTDVRSARFTVRTAQQLFRAFAPTLDYALCVGGNYGVLTDLLRHEPEPIARQARFGPLALRHLCRSYNQQRGEKINQYLQHIRALRWQPVDLGFDNE